MAARRAMRRMPVMNGLSSTLEEMSRGLPAKVDNDHPPDRLSLDSHQEILLPRLYDKRASSAYVTGSPKK
jgi:hypothetical protein